MVHISHLGAMGSSLPAVTNDGDLEVTELANCAAKPGGKHDKNGLLKDIQMRSKWVKW